MGFHIIGDADTVLGYRFAGLSGDVVETAEEASRGFQGRHRQQPQGRAADHRGCRRHAGRRRDRPPPQLQTAVLAVMQDI